MANTVSNVGVGKPKVGGAVFVAPKGTALPTSASEELNEAYKCLGYISEDGITVSESRESEALKEVLESAACDSKELSLILSLGGGTIVCEENAALLHEKSTVIFLRAKLETLEMRLEGGKDKRPLLKNHSISPLLAERTPLYESNSDIIIDTDALNTTEVAQLIIESLKYYNRE